MQICLVYDHVFPQTVGGAERWMRDLALRLAAVRSRRHVPHDAPLGRGRRPQLAGVRVVGLTDAGNVYRENRRTLGPPLRFGVAVARHLAAHGSEYDVVHTASFPYFPLLAAGALRRRGGYGLFVDWHEVWTREYWRRYAGSLAGTIGWIVQRTCVRLRHNAYCMSRMHAERLVTEGYRGAPTILPGLYAGPVEPTRRGYVDPTSSSTPAGTSARSESMPSSAALLSRSCSDPIFASISTATAPSDRGSNRSCATSDSTSAVRVLGRRPEEEVAERWPERRAWRRLRSARATGSSSSRPPPADPERRRRRAGKRRGRAPARRCERRRRAGRSPPETRGALLRVLEWRRPSRVDRTLVRRQRPELADRTLARSRSRGLRAISRRLRTVPSGADLPEASDTRDKPTPAAPSGTRSGVLLAAASVVAVGLNYVFLLATGRLLGSDDYGAFAALLGLLTLILLPTGAVQLAVSREISRRVALGDADGADAFSRATLRLGLLLTAPLVAIALVFVIPLRELLDIDSTAAVALAAVGLVAALVFPVAMGALQGYQRFHAVAVLYVLPFAVRLGLLGVIAAVGYRVGGAMLAAIVGGIAAAALAVVLLRQPLRRSARTPRPALGSFLRYLWPVVVGLIGLAVLTNIDLLVVKARFSDDAGAYAAASAFARVAFFLPATILAVLFPRTAARQARGEDTADILGRSLLVTAGFGGVLTLFYAMAGRGLVHTSFGADFASGGELLVPFTISMALFALANVLVGFHLSRDETRYAWIVACFVPAQLVLLALLPNSVRQVIWVDVALGLALLASHEIFVESSVPALTAGLGRLRETVWLRRRHVAEALVATASAAALVCVLFWSLVSSIGSSAVGGDGSDAAGTIGWLWRLQHEGYHLFGTTVHKLDGRADRLGADQRTEPAVAPPLLPRLPCDEGRRRGDRLQPRRSHRLRALRGDDVPPRPLPRVLAARRGVGRDRVHHLSLAPRARRARFARAPGDPGAPRSSPSSPLPIARFHPASPSSASRRLRRGSRPATSASWRSWVPLLSRWQPPWLRADPNGYGSSSGLPRAHSRRRWCSSWARPPREWARARDSSARSRISRYTAFDRSSSSSPRRTVSSPAITWRPFTPAGCTGRIRSRRATTSASSRSGSPPAGSSWRGADAPA